MLQVFNIVVYVVMHDLIVEVPKSGSVTRGVPFHQDAGYNLQLIFIFSNIFAIGGYGLDDAYLMYTQGSCGVRKLSNFLSDSMDPGP